MYVLKNISSTIKNFLSLLTIYFIPKKLLFSKKVFVTVLQN